jgi:hypothetical protein
LAVGSAVNQTARQVGGAVGVAVLVAILGNPASPQAALPHFRHLWLLSCAMAAAAGVISLMLRPAWAEARRQTPIEAVAVPVAATCE